MTTPNGPAGDPLPEARIAEAKAIHPGDLRIEPQYLPQRQSDADQQHQNDQAVQGRVRHERDLDLLAQHGDNRAHEHHKHQHAEEEDARRGQFERIEFSCHEHKS